MSDYVRLSALQSAPVEHFPACTDPTFSAQEVIPCNLPMTVTSMSEGYHLDSSDFLGTSISDVEPVSEPVVQSREEMTVTIEGQANRRMPEAFLNLLRMRSLGDEQRRTGMAKIMKAESVWCTGSSNSRLEMARVERTTERLSFKSTEHVGVWRAVRGAVVLQQVHQEWWERYSPALAGLRRT